MGRISEKYVYKTTPVCKSESVVKGDKYRFTVLTHCLMRLEYSETGIFEDRATQTVINRCFDVPEYRVIRRGETIKIVTDSMELIYHGGKFTRNSLSAKFAGELRGVKYEWYYGDDVRNLKGTARTLDEVDGECEIENGIMGRDAMAVLDDSNTLILADDGWVDVRNSENVDIYLFAYKHNYLEALRDYYKLTGATPMLPRYALGNWWSRFYRYTQDEYENLVHEFEEKEIPFSVAVIDMDWHYTDIKPEYGSGWTGFSWNVELFPNPNGFLEFLHRHGMKPTLNLHPAEGIAAHEDRYKALAEAMGVDSEKEETVDFDIANPLFVERYFKNLLHPMEKEGVEFWWMDWQQGNTTKIQGLDPLWMLNHYHYTDMLRTNKRPMIFSRYSGPGSHRYPVGFSGDTYVTWESLDFQPYFTTTATNIGYGWWSHDIGGHMFGYRDDELVTRWVQYGVFSPIMRLHSMCNDFCSKEPWRYNKISEIVMTDFLRLRHKLIPYLYTMNYKAYEDGEPLVIPLYYRHNCEEAYTYNRNEYYFGSEMIVSPITLKSDSVTLMGEVKAYLPDGMWFDFFNNRCYKGNNCYRMYRDIYTVPVLVKAGGIIPMALPDYVNDISNPKSIELHIFPGANNKFTLYEDDGESMDYREGICVKTDFEIQWGRHPKFIIHEPCGSEDIVVHDRNYTLVFHKLSQTRNIRATEDEKNISFEYKYENGNLYIELQNINGDVKIEFNDEIDISKNNHKEDVFNILLKAQCGNDLKEKIYNLLLLSPDSFVTGITAMDIDRKLYNALIEAVI